MKLQHDAINKQSKVSTNVAYTKLLNFFRKNSRPTFTSKLTCWPVTPVQWLRDCSSLKTTKLQLSTDITWHVKWVQYAFMRKAQFHYLPAFTTKLVFKSKLLNKTTGRTPRDIISFTLKNLNSFIDTQLHPYSLRGEYRINRCQRKE